MWRVLIASVVHSRQILPFGIWRARTTEGGGIWRARIALSFFKEACAHHSVVQARQSLRRSGSGDPELQGWEGYLTSVNCKEFVTRIPNYRGGPMPV